MNHGRTLALGKSFTLAQPEEQLQGMEKAATALLGMPSAHPRITRQRSDNHEPHYIINATRERK
jgi:hypothetical protein